MSQKSKSLRDYHALSGSSSDGHSLWSSIESQLAVLQASKLQPIAEDYNFDVFHHDTYSQSTGRSTPVISLVYNHWTTSRPLVLDCIGDCLTDYCGEPVMCLEGRDSVTPHPRIPGWMISSCDSDPILNQMSFAVHPFDSMSEDILSVSQLVLFVMDLTDGERWTELSRQRLKQLRSLNSNLHVVVTGDVESSESLQTQLPLIMWSLARGLNSPEAPSIHFYTPEGDNDDLYSILLEVPLRGVSQRVSSLDRSARAARAHACILSYIKSQLPVFNPKSRQSKLVEDLQNLLPVVANKYKIPLSDLQQIATSVFQSDLLKFDFARIKKVKDINFTLITELIDREIPKIRRLIPLVEGPIFSASPPPNLPALNVNRYITDFTGLTPDPASMTVRSTPELKAHLRIFSSSLPSPILHRIWRLSDADNDGALTLKEYAVFRTLAEWVKTNELPSVLPPGWV
jgi:hypothetical protein